MQIFKQHNVYFSVFLMYFSVFIKITIKITIIFQKARVNDAYEKSEILESFAKHHDAYKKISVLRTVLAEKKPLARK